MIVPQQATILCDMCNHEKQTLIDIWSVRQTRGIVNSSPVMWLHVAEEEMTVITFKFMTSAQYKESRSMQSFSIMSLVINDTTGCLIYVFAHSYKTILWHANNKTHRGDKLCWLQTILSDSLSVCVLMLVCRWRSATVHLCRREHWVWLAHFVCSPQSKEKFHSLSVKKHLEFHVFSWAKQKTLKKKSLDATKRDRFWSQTSALTTQRVLEKSLSLSKGSCIPELTSFLWAFQGRHSSSRLIFS